MAGVADGDQLGQGLDVLAVISTSFSGCAAARLTPAWTALTSELLPMPRAPQRRTLFAGSPRANRSVFSSRSHERGRSP